MKVKPEALIVMAVVLVASYALFAFIRDDAACESSGGAYVQTSRGWQCIKK